MTEKRKNEFTNELVASKTKEERITIEKQIVNDWMKNQVGFIKWEIQTNSDGSYIDIVYRKSKEDSKRAEKEMVNIPNVSEWYGYYKEGSVSSKNLITFAEL